MQNILGLNMRGWFFLLLVFLLQSSVLFAESEAPTVNIKESSKPLFDPGWFDKQQNLITDVEPFLHKLRKKREVFTRKQNLEKIKFVQDLQSRGLDAEESQIKLMKFHQKQLKQLEKFRAKQTKKLDKYNYKKRKDLPNFHIQEKNQKRVEFIQKQNEARKKYYDKIGKKGYPQSVFEEKTEKFDTKQHEERVKFLNKLNKDREKYIKKVNNE